MIAVGMGIKIALTMAETFLVAIGVAQVIGHLSFLLAFDGRQGVKKGQR